jgi:hypothetical protein
VLLKRITTIRNVFANLRNGPTDDEGGTNQET